MAGKARAWATRPVLAIGVLLAIGSAAPARAADAPVVLEHLSFRQGRLRIELPRVEARGTALTPAELRDILDPSSPLDVGQRLTRLSAASVSAPEVTFRMDPKPGEGREQTVTIHDVLLSDVVAGKAAALSIRAVDGSFSTGDGETDALAIGAVTAHAVDPQLALQIATGRRTDKDLPVSPVLHDAAVETIKLTDNAGKVFAVDRLDTGALEGRPFLDRPADLVRRLEESPDALNPVATNPAFASLVDVGTSLKLERLKLSGVSFDGGDGRSGFKLGTFALNAAGSATVPLVEIDGAKLDAEDVHLSMDSAILSGSGTSAVFTRAAMLLRGQTLASPLVDAAGGGVEFKTSGIHVALPATDPDGPFPPGTVNTVDVPAFTFGESVASGGATAEAHTRAEVRYDIPPGGSDSTIQNLRDLGLSHLDATFGYRVSYDLVGHAVRLDEFSFGGKGLGSVTLAGRVADMPDAPFRPGLTSNDAAALFGGATLRDATATLVDEGFKDRALAMMARQGGTSPAMMKAGLKTKVDLALPDLLGRTPAEAAVAQAIDGFIDAGGTLVLSAHSPKGVTMSDIAAASDPSELLGQLDVTASSRR